MQVARECLAPRARLADQQHRRFVGSNLLHLFAQLVHQAALADRRDQRRNQGALCLPAPAPRLERMFDGAQQLGDRQRLLDEIERAEARRLDRGLDCPVPGQHDHRETQHVLLGPFAQQRDAVGVGHPDVQQHEVRLLACAGAARGGGIGRRLDLVAFLGEDLAQQPADVGLVVDDENSRRTHARSLLAAGSVMEMRAPPCGTFSSSTWPPCSSTIRRTIARPSPVPFGLLVT